MSQIEDILKHFPDAVVLREQDGDRVYADRELAPHCGFLSIRESEILADVVRSTGGAWCEIGSHVGWSAAVIVDAGAKALAMIDPAYADAKNGICKRMILNLVKAIDIPRTWPVGLTSAQFLKYNRDMFDGFLIDGDHDSPNPLNDAKGASEYLKPGGVIVLHDYNGRPIKDAVDWLCENGFTAEIHRTMNGLAVCRGAAQ